MAGSLRVVSSDCLACQIRSLPNASAENVAGNLGIGALLEQERVSWAGHVARLGLEDKPQQIGICLVAKGI